jgi:hypothetical protein
LTFCDDLLSLWCQNNQRYNQLLWEKNHRTFESFDVKQSGNLSINVTRLYTSCWNWAILVMLNIRKWLVRLAINDCGQYHSFSLGKIAKKKKCSCWIAICAEHDLGQNSSYVYIMKPPAGWGLESFKLTKGYFWIEIVYIIGKLNIHQWNLFYSITWRWVWECLKFLWKFFQALTSCRVGCMVWQSQSDSWHNDTHLNSTVDNKKTSPLKSFLQHAVKSNGSVPGVDSIPTGSQDDTHGIPIPLNGQIGSVCIYHDAVSANQVKRLYTAGPNNLTVFNEDSELLDLPGKMVLYYNARVRLCNFMTPDIDRTTSMQFLKFLLILVTIVTEIHFTYWNLTLTFKWPSRSNFQNTGFWTEHCVLQMHDVTKRSASYVWQYSNCWHNVISFNIPYMTLQELIENLIQSLLKHIFFFFSSSTLKI